ncbi:ArsR/SmtB family transcription factor [Lactimicrobium massiliense]|uniref:ArsR/SmtB family transcription factor n=1 Tax=Lactimicrobium massiliense TaxID=2161814 RepID=UPI001FD90611|nr:metalloregulator ArsR/SmtB family transcription factor [Lactimicrobium massiliense]
MKRVNRMGCREDARKIKALADENRLAIMLVLQHGEMCGCDLLARLKISQPTLSHHMIILADSGLVNCCRQGKWMYYSISEKGVRAFREMIGMYARCDCETDSSVSCGCGK